MPRKVKTLAVASSEQTVSVEEAPQSRQSYLSEFASQPFEVIFRYRAIARLLQVDPDLMIKDLKVMPIDHLERKYRHKMNGHKAGSGQRVFVVETREDEAPRRAQVEAMFGALRGELPELPEQRIDLDASSELVGAMS